MLLNSEYYVLKQINKNPNEFNVVKLCPKLDKNKTFLTLISLQEKGFLKNVSRSIDCSVCSYEITLQGTNYIEYERKEILSILAKSFVLPVIVSVITTIITLAIKGLL